MTDLQDDIEEMLEDFDGCEECGSKTLTGRVEQDILKVFWHDGVVSTEELIGYDTPFYVVLVCKRCNHKHKSICTPF